MNELRPIGTEFEITYPPIKSSNSNLLSKGDTIMKYRITAHRRATRYLGDEKGIMVEVIEAISERKE